MPMLNDSLAPEPIEWDESFGSPNLEVRKPCKDVDGDTEHKYVMKGERDKWRDQALYLTRCMTEIEEWPDNGNQYGQYKIKKFAHRILEGLREEGRL